MSSETGVAVAMIAAAGLLFLGVAARSLRPESRLRRAYGTDPDDEAARSNALVLGASGAGLLALAAAIALDVPERVLGTGTVLVCAGLCVVLGWLVRYRDRRELLTSPDVDRETARRLGAAVVLCGVLLLPLAPAVWVGASDAVVVGLGLGGAFVSLLAIAYAYR